MSRGICCLLTLFGVAALTTAQEPKKDPQVRGPEYIEVTVWYAVVIGDGTVAGADKVVPIGPARHDKKEAEVDEENWKQEHPKSLRLTDVRPSTVRVPVNKPSAVKQPEPIPPAKAVPKPGVNDASKLIRVRGYKVVDGKFVRDESLDFETADYDKASEGYWLIRGREGYSATWNDPAGRKPKLSGGEKPWVDIGPYNPPKPELTKESLEGTSWIVYEEANFQKGFRLEKQGKITQFWQGENMPRDDKWSVTGQTVVIENPYGGLQGKFEGGLSGDALEGTVWSRDALGKYHSPVKASFKKKK